jgi:hypothetical protein
MKIRLVPPEYANFNGHFGPTLFTDGVSEDISAATFRTLSALVTVEIVEGEWQADYDAMREVAATTERYPTLAELQAQEAAQDAVPQVAADATQPGQVYTVEELEAIADAKGIAGLREVGEVVGVRANSISKLISGILAAQKAPEADASFLAAGPDALAPAPQVEQEAAPEAEQETAPAQE